MRVISLGDISIWLRFVKYVSLIKFNNYKFKRISLLNSDGFSILRYVREVVYDKMPAPAAIVFWSSNHSKEIFTFLTIFKKKFNFRVGS